MSFGAAFDLGISTLQAAPTGDIYSQFGINSGASDKGNQLQAAVTRSQYDDYQRRFSPWLGTLTSMTSDAYVNGEKQRWAGDISKSATLSANNAATASSRGLSQFGAAQDGRANAQNQSLGLLGAGSNTVANTNNMNQSIDDRLLTLMSGQSLSA